MLIADRGTQFQSTPFKGLNYLVGTKHIRITSYHPNRMVERFLRQLKVSLAKRAKKTDWYSYTPGAL